MKKLRIVFFQTMIISAAILLGIGVQTLIQHLTYEDYYLMEWPWYAPLSIIFTGVISSLPTFFLLNLDELSTTAVRIRILIHFVLLGGIVSLCGYLFKWYGTVSELIPILIMYVLIYIFVWGATLWLAKSDERKINDAIKSFQDSE